MARRALRAIQPVIVVAVLLSVALSAQGGREWIQPYHKGVDLIQQKKYQEAITQLEIAIKTSPNAQLNKLEEGVFRTDYIPYYWLGVAYFELKEYTKAQEYFQKAQSPASKDWKDKKEAAKFTDYQQKVVALAAQPTPSQPTLTARGPDPTPPTPPPPPPARSTGSDSEPARPAQAADARTATQPEPPKTTPETIVARGNVAPGGGVVPTPAQPSNSNANAANVNSGIEDSRRLVNAGKSYAAQGKYADAEASYSSAFQKNPNNLEAKDALQKSRTFATLVRDARSLRDKKGSADAARKKFEDARGLDPSRFDREGLNALLTPLIAATGQDPLKESLRTALLALLQGNPQGSISILEPISQQNASGATAATLHAYLGVAYATRALSSAKPDDQSRWKDTALEQFKLALTSQRDFQLSPRVVSPKILAMFDQARR